MSLVLAIVNAWRPSLSHLQEVEDFGTNPGALRMLTYLPDNLSPRPALVVVLHGSMQSAADYDLGAGWSTLADRYGFALLMPEQSRRNNLNRSFNWFQRNDTQRGEGEAHSIAQMVEQMGRVRRRDSLRGQMPSDVEIGGILAFLDRLVMGARFLERLLLRPRGFIQGAIARFEIAADLRDAFVDFFQGQILPVKFFFRLASGFGCAETCAHNFRALIG